MSAAPSQVRVEYLGPLIEAVLIGSALGGLVALIAHAWIGAVAGGVAALTLLIVFTHRARRRRRLAKLPFPSSMRDVLHETVPYYERLSESERTRFEREIIFFLDEHVVTGPRRAPLSERVRVLVAASAVMLVFGRPSFRYPRLRDIVVYQDAFDEAYREGHAKHILGMVHGQGPILFSARALEEGFKNPRDGHHVGLHEFAHVLDFQTGDIDGIPSLMPWQSIAPWIRVMHDEVRRVRARRSILRRYATTNEAEFFAVATEAFFERPRELRQKHSELYALLRDTYGQDPAEWVGPRR